MKKKLRKPRAKRVTVMAYSFESCAINATFDDCGLKW